MNFLGMQVNFVSNVFFYVFSSQENIFASHELKKNILFFPNMHVYFKIDPRGPL